MAILSDVPASSIAVSAPATPPTVEDVLAARRVLTRYLPPTPLWSYPVLNARLGATVFIKHENVQPTGAFKVRGGINLLATMSEEERSRGVLSYSTGNHAQSLAYAARLFGVRCVIVMPDPPQPVKARAVEALGATVIAHGATLTESREHAEQLARSSGMRLVSPGDEPALIAGVGTAYLEICEQASDLDVILVPVGSGSGAAAACVVTAALAPRCQVIAVQSAASPAAHDSWRTGSCVNRPNRTTVEGLATGCGFALPQSLIAERLADFILVSDAEIAAAQRVLVEHAHTLAEGAGAAALAPLLRDDHPWVGKRVAVVCSGGNASLTELTTALTSATVQE